MIKSYYGHWFSFLQQHLGDEELEEKRSSNRYYSLAVQQEGLTG